MDTVLLSDNNKDSRLLWIPYFIQIFLLLNIVLMFVGIRYVYVGADCLGFLFLMGKFYFQKINLLYQLKVFYLVSLIVTTIFQIVFLPGMSVPYMILGLISYIIAPSFWLILSLRVQDSEEFYKQLIYKLRYVVLGTCLLGFIQYYFSPTLWGILDQVDSAQFQYASKLDKDTYSTFLRLTSLWCSPQICGLFCALYIVAYYSFFKKDLRFYFFMIPIFLCGFMTSNKSFLLNMFLLFLIKVKVTLFVKILGFICALLTLFCISVVFPDHALARIVSVDRVWEEEVVEAERFNIYKDTVAQTRFGGNGVGTMQHGGDKEEEIQVAESMILQILNELGIIPFILFMMIIAWQFFASSSKVRLLIFLVFLSSIYVHALSTIHMFLFYGVLFLDFPRKREDQKIPEADALPSEQKPAVHPV